jgi:Fe-S cluster biosynthesis and repair protein YggX
MDFPPYPDWRIGKRLYFNVNKGVGSLAKTMAPMLVNENRLIADPAARKLFKRTNRKNTFFGEGADATTGYVPEELNTAN